MSYDTSEAVSIIPAAFYWSKKLQRSTRVEDASMDPTYLSVEEHQCHVQRKDVRWDIFCCSYSE